MDHHVWVRQSHRSFSGPSLCLCERQPPPSPPPLCGSAVSYWYFFRDDNDHHETYPILNAARRVFRYHLGSAAFGAGIIAICQFIRYVLATIDYYTKDLQEQNILYKLAIKCAQCAMWCLKKTIEFVSYYGFVYIAMDGYSFCPACRKTFAFLVVPKHAVQTAVNKTVEKIIVVIIAWTTPTFCALICYAWYALLPRLEHMTLPSPEPGFRARSWLTDAQAGR